MTMTLLSAKNCFDLCKSYLPAYKPYYSNPRPLVMTEKDVVVSWSAKSASVQLLMWYLAAEGLLDEAMDFHLWPHNYREKVLYQKTGFRKALSRLQHRKGEGWSLIKIMRSPLKRLVSSYRHTLRFGYADKDISRTLGRRITSQEGFSIATFIQFLAEIDIRNCNMHFRTQVNPIDNLEFKQRFVINADQANLFSEINKIEIRLGLDPTEFKKIRHFDEVGQRHNSKQADLQNIENLLTKVFNRQDARHEWPGKQLREIPEVKTAAKKIYALDYGFLEDSYFSL